MNENIFREYDIRGVTGKELDGETMELIGKGLGTFVREEFGGDKVVIGRDCRLTSEQYAGRVIEGLQSTGCNVIDIGMVPTPVLYFAIFRYLPNGKDVGAVVTASHNPKEFNGIKMRSTDKFIFGERIQLVSRRNNLDEERFGLVSRLIVDQCDSPVMNQIPITEFQNLGIQCRLKDGIPGIFQFPQIVPCFFVEVDGGCPEDLGQGSIRRRLNQQGYVLVTRDAKILGWLADTNLAPRLPCLAIFGRASVFLPLQLGDG